MRKIIAGFVLLTVASGASAVEGNSWKKEKGMTPYRLVNNDYRLVSTSHSVASNTRTEYLYFQKEKSVYRCLNMKQGTGSSKVRCSALVETSRK